MIDCLIINNATICPVTVAFILRMSYQDILSEKLKILNIYSRKYDGSILSEYVSLRC